MKIIEHVVLGILSFMVMLLCGTATMKILEVLLQLSYENIWTIGFKVGFIAWLGLFVISRMKKKENIKEDK